MSRGLDVVIRIRSKEYEDISGILPKLAYELVEMEVWELEYEDCSSFLGEEGYFEFFTSSNSADDRYDQALLKLSKKHPELLFRIEAITDCHEGYATNYDNGRREELNLRLSFEEPTSVFY